MFASYLRQLKIAFNCNVFKDFEAVTLLNVGINGNETADWIAKKGY